MGKSSKLSAGLVPCFFMANDGFNDRCEPSWVADPLRSFHTGGISDHNEGQGVSFTVQFTPLPKAGKKCQKNAALKMVLRIVYIHKAMGLCDMITKIVVQLKHQDFFQDLETINDDVVELIPLQLETVSRPTLFLSIVFASLVSFC